MRGSVTVSAWVIAALILMAVPASAQVRIGAHGVRAADAFGGTNGVGARIRVGVPLLPVSAAINGEYFFPSCDPEDCSLYGATVDLNYSLPVPVIQPYAGIGWSIRKVEIGDVASTESGINIGVGVELGLVAIRPYADLRYEFADAPEKQLMLRLGVMF